MRFYAIAALLPLFACGSAKSGQTPSETLAQARPGYVEIMPAARMAQYEGQLPQVEDPTLSAILQNPDLMWYDKQSLIPGYQDSMGDPKGMRPNTIQPELINLAVPGGHEKIFAESGRFNFPFGTGGLDDSDNRFGINFWLPPRDGSRILPVAYWREDFSRWRWLFPIGTVIGEVLFETFPDGASRVFEIRTRTRGLTEWDSKIFRPFPSSQSLADAVKNARPQWAADAELSALVNHLETPNNLTAKSLKSVDYAEGWDQLDGYLDVLPTVHDQKLMQDLLASTSFKSVTGTVWKQDGNKVTYAPTVNAGPSIVPHQYVAGMFKVDNNFCDRCHKDAGRAFRDFRETEPTMAYGELWGEDKIFSWNLFDSSKFVNDDGTVRNFNDDNRRVKAEFQSAGLVDRYNEAPEPSNQYQDLPRDWHYRPF